MSVKLLYLLLLLFLLYRCSPKTLLTGPSAKADVDSVLFYQQNELSDPLLDEIKKTPGNEVRLKTQLLPPPPPPASNYREIDGFRIQVFAGTDSLNALTMKEQFASEEEDSVYLIYEKGLYKIQVGDYPQRPQADNKKQALQARGHSGAWVVPRLIHIPLDSSAADSVAEQRPQRFGEGSVSNQPAGPYKIQVMATSNLDKARELVSDLQSRFSYYAFYELSGAVYKVFLGNFQTRPEAESFLIKVRSGGFKDAWLVY